MNKNIIEIIAIVLVIIIVIGTIFGGLIFILNRVGNDIDEVLKADTIKCEEAGGIMIGFIPSCKFPPTK